MIVKCYRCHSDCESNVRVLVTVDHTQLCSSSFIQKKKCKSLYLRKPDSGSHEHGTFTGSSPEKCRFMQRGATSEARHCFHQTCSKVRSPIRQKKKNVFWQTAALLAYILARRTTRFTQGFLMETGHSTVLCCAARCHDHRPSSEDSLRTFSKTASCRTALRGMIGRL